MNKQVKESNGLLLYKKSHNKAEEKKKPAQKLESELQKDMKSTVTVSCLLPNCAK